MFIKEIIYYYDLRDLKNILLNIYRNWRIKQKVRLKHTNDLYRMLKEFMIAKYYNVNIIIYKYNYVRIYDTYHLLF